MPYRNAPIHPILRLIYSFLRFTTRVGLSVFYRRRLVLGRENLRFDGPAIVVSNHPSTLMDPLNVGLNIRQVMFFLANYGLFRNPISNWLLTRLYCIPVKRKEDVAAGEARDNDEAFEKSYQHLEKSGVLYIAAEGVSWMNRYVRPFKTGTARIAFGAERRNNWQLGVKIIPVGISYDAPRVFRSHVTVEYGAAIDARPWKEAFAQDAEKAVDDFTAHIQNAVRALTLDSGSAEGDSFVDQMEMMVRNTQSGFVAHEAFLALKAFLAKNIQNEKIKAQVAHYFVALHQAGLTDRGVSMQSGNLGNKAVYAFAPVFLLLLAPFFLLGYGFWFLPCWLPFRLCKALKLYPGYDSNIKMLAGLFTFPLALWGGWELAFWLSGNEIWAWASLGLFALCGFIAEIYMDIAQAWWQWRKTRLFEKKDSKAWLELSTARTEIIQTMALSSDTLSHPQ